MSRCFECGGKTAADRLTAVGDAVFCEKCFAELLTKAEGAAVATATASPTAPIAQREGAPSAGSSPQRRTSRNACLVCEKPMIAGEPAMAFPGGHICRSCANDMAAELAEAPGPSAATDVSAVADANAVADTATGSGGGTPGSATAQCAGCDRLMPGPGSYRLIEGRPYCAACVPFYSAYHAQKSVPRAPVAVQERAERDASGQCDCCSTALGSSAIERDGFRICSACQATDSALALTVARARHRHRLLSLSKSLGVSEDKL